METMESYERLTSPMDLVKALDDPGKVLVIKEAITRIWEGARENGKFDAAVCVQCWRLHWGQHPMKGCETRHMKADQDGDLCTKNGTQILDQDGNPVPQCNPEVPLWPMRYDIGVVIPKDAS